MRQIQRIYSNHRLLANSPGVALRRTSSGKWVLGTPDAPDAIGTFDDVTDAWKALDAIDLAELDSNYASAAA